MEDERKTRQELLHELVRLRQWVGDLHGTGQAPFAADDGRLLALGLALSRVRDEVWRMRRAEDIQTVLEAVGDGLELNNGLTANFMQELAWQSTRCQSRWYNN